MLVVPASDRLQAALVELSTVHFEHLSSEVEYKICMGEFSCFKTVLTNVKFEHVLIKLWVGPQFPCLKTHRIQKGEGTPDTSVCIYIYISLFSASQIAKTPMALCQHFQDQQPIKAAWSNI